MKIFLCFIPETSLSELALKDHVTCLYQISSGGVKWVKWFFNGCVSAWSLIAVHLQFSSEFNTNTTPSALPSAVHMFTALTFYLKL